MRQPIKVLIYVYRRTASRHEFLKLHPQPATAAFWQGVIGEVEPRETPLKTALRELRIQTGLGGLVLRELVYQFSFPVENYRQERHEWKVRSTIEHLFVTQAQTDAVITLDPRQHSAFLWCSFAGALEMLRWGEDKEALRRAEEFVRIGS